MVSKNKAIETSQKILEKKLEKISLYTRQDEYLAFICRQLALIEDKLNIMAYNEK